MEETGMMRCKEVATLLDTEQVADESFRKRFAVRLHLMMCKHCRRFARQLRHLHVGAQSMRSAIDSEAAAADLDQKISRRLGLTDPGTRE